MRATLPGITRARRLLLRSIGIFRHGRWPGPMSLLSIVLALGATAACADEYPSAPAPRVPYGAQGQLDPTAPPRAPAPTPIESEEPTLAAVPRRDPAQVLVLQSTHLDRPAEVVGVVDVHAPMGSHAAALDVVRQRAAEMGADAVVSVEFHHGEGDGQPTHLSGLPVRFVDHAP